MRQLIKCVLIALHVLFWVVFLRHIQVFGAVSPFPDLDAYRLLWSAMTHGVNPYTVSSMQTFGPPLVILANAPFFLFSMGVSHLLLLLLNVVSGYLTCWILSKRRTLLWLLLSLLFWMTFPARFSILMGQPGPFLALLVTLALTNTRVRSLAIAVLITFKTNFLVVLVGLIRSHHRVLIRTLCWLSLIGVGSLIVIHPEWYQYYVTHSLIGTLQGSVSGLDYYNQSLHSTLGRLGMSGMYPAIYVGIAVCTLVVLLVSGSLELGIVLSLLLSPIVWQHYFIVLFPVLFRLFIHQKGWRKWGVLVCFVLLNLDVPAFHTMNPSVIAGLAASHGYIGLCGLTFLCILPMIKPVVCESFTRRFTGCDSASGID